MGLWHKQGESVDDTSTRGRSDNSASHYTESQFYRIHLLILKEWLIYVQLMMFQILFYAPLFLILSIRFMFYFFINMIKYLVLGLILTMARTNLIL